MDYPAQLKQARTALPAKNYKDIHQMARFRRLVEFTHNQSPLVKYGSKDAQKAAAIAFIALEGTNMPKVQKDAAIHAIFWNYDPSEDRTTKNPVITWHEVK